MPKYRKTALTEFQQFVPSNKPWPDGVVENSASPTGYAIMTLENTKVEFEVTPNDWIATGAKGEHWAVKPDVFESTYELAE